MSEIGIISVVSVKEASTALTADTAASATTIPVDDAAVFAVDGSEAGQVRINDEVYDYTAVDLEADKITLATGLLAVAEEGDLAYVWNETTGDVYTEWVADVRLEPVDDTEDAVEAFIDYALIPLLPEGIRETGFGEAVVIEQRGSSLHVADVLGSTPVIDEPFVPEQPKTDGVAPAASPTPTLRPGIKTLFVFWEEVVNADPVTYDVHVSTAVGFTASAATLVGSALGTGPLVIRGLSDGTPLDAGTTYYVRIVAHDADGYAPQGGEASATPALVTSDDVTAEFILANEVYANDGYFGRVAAEQIDTGGLNADMAVLGSLSVGEGIHIDPANGIQVQTPSGVTNLPADGGRARIAGDLTAESLEVKGNLEIRGTNNEISKNASVTLESGVTPPKAPPVVYSYYPTRTIHDGFNTRGFVFHSSRNRYYSTESVVSGSITTLERTGGDNYTWVGNYGLNATWSEIQSALGGITMIGNTAYVLCQTTVPVPGTYYGRWYVYRLSWTGTDWNPLSKWLYEPTSFLGGNSPYTPAIGTDGTNIFIAQSGEGGRTWNTQFTSTGTFVDRTELLYEDSDQFRTSRDVTSWTYTSADFGAPRWVLTLKGIAWAHVFDPANSLKRSSADTFRLADSDTRGLLFDGTVFHARTADTVYLHSQITTEPTVRTVSTWRLENLSNSPSYADAETIPGPENVHTPLKRAWLAIQSGTAIPNDGGDPTDPDSISFYASVDSGLFMRVATPPAGEIQIELEALPISGGTPPASSYGFGEGTPAEIVSAAVDGDGPIVHLRGDGSGRVGPLSWDDLGRPAGEVTPAGSVTMFAGAVIPNGWLLCDGSEVDTTQYARLYGAIGDTFGSATTGYFRLPNLTARFPRGAGTVGATGGASTHSHTHNISIGDHNVNPDQGPNTGSRNRTTTGGHNVSGGVNSSSSLPPYLDLNYIIRT